MNNKKGRSILIIYKNNDNRLRWEKGLKDIGYNVNCENDYISGWTKYKESQPTVVFLGLDVNDQKGFGEFLDKKIRYEKGVRTPIPVFIILPDNIYLYLNKEDIKVIPYIYPHSGVRTPYFLESIVSSKTLSKKIKGR